MESSWWLALVLGGGIPLLVWILRSWNEFMFVAPLKAAKLPPGHMSLPFLGEMLSFLWYFKFSGRPDDFINSKRKRYGGAGLYRTYLFGSPSIIGCSPAFNKFVFQSEQLFHNKWPSPELLGFNSLAAVNGKSHTRLRSYVSNTINRPDALKKIAEMVQPHIISSLQSWAQKGRVNGIYQIKKVTFENIGKFFVSFEPGPLLDEIDQYFADMVKGIRALRFNFPGTAYHRSLQCRKKLMAIFREELEKRKKCGNSTTEDRNDLMEGLMRMKDEEGKQLSDEMVLDNIVSLVLAGYESTSLTLMWALYYLAKFPAVLQRLRDENMALSQKKKGDFLTIEDIVLLKYTNKVVEETIRMANIAAFTFREVMEDVNYQGYRIPKGWRIILWLRYSHTDPNNFEDPMNFNPDRWNGPAKPGTYQVFGGGSRICAGNMLARMQVAIFLHHLVVGYKWELINPEAKIVYLPHPKPEDGVEIAISTI